MTNNEVTDFSSILMSNSQHENQFRSPNADRRAGSAQSQEQKLQLIVSWVVVVVLIVFAIALMIGLFTVSLTEGTFWRNMVEKQFPVIVALPLAGLGALFVALVLRISAGSIEFEVAGVKFKGGSAPIVFWLLCFLAIAVAIKMLWIG